MTEAELEAIRLKRNTGNPFAQHVGIETVRIGEGEADCVVDLRPEHLNLMGNVHGGVPLALADVATGAAAAGCGVNAVTSSGSYHFLRAVRGSSQLRAHAHVVKCGASLIVCDVELYDDADALVGKGTFELFVLA